MIEYIAVVLFIICFFVNIISNDTIIRTMSLLYIMMIAVTGWLFVHHMMEKPIIIQKSSDSEWELSNNYEIKSDTCITNIKLIKNIETNQLDTVYPTTCYKILKK